jgi:L-ribulose-5-phosphate 4-epimerase
LTWGNASAREGDLVAIKPSGGPYKDLTPDQIVVLDLQGNKIEGALVPSSDTETHIVLYRAWPEVDGIVHTHSRAATIWAQAGLPIPCLGTTHADHFCGDIPVTRELSPTEIAHDYLAATGRAITEAAAHPQVQAVLVTHHAPFVWGATLEEALENAIALERIADMALQSLALNPELRGLPEALRERHFNRKHGPDATYGQRE